MGTQGAAVIIGLSGLARSGKDTAADILVEHFGFKKIAFADNLKAGCAAMLGLPLARMYEGDRESILPNWGFSIRHFLQVMGTECVRVNFGPDFWIKSAMQTISREYGTHCTRFVVCDVRFDNEAEWVRGIDGGQVVHIDRLGIKRMNHASEAGVEERHQDARLCNSGTLEEFKNLVVTWAMRRGL